MADVKDTKIPDLGTPWEGYAGQRVEEFIKERLGGVDTIAEDVKAKAGYMERIDTEEGAGVVTVGLFASEATYRQWAADKEGKAELLLSSVDIPQGGGSGGEASYIVKLGNAGARNLTATRQADLVARLRFTSQLYDPSDGSTTDTNEEATLQIETRMEGAAAWKVAGTMTIASQEASNVDAYTTVDLSPYIVSGTQSVRFIATGKTSEKKTAYVNMTVTLTNIEVEIGLKWQSPIEYRPTAPTMAIPVRVKGNVSKTLHVRVRNVGGTQYDKSYEYALGTATYTETAYQAQVDHPRQHGVYSIETWITSGESVRTDPVTEQMMCSVAGEKTALMAVNNVGQFQNWSSVHAFDYAIYNPNAQTTDVTFALTRVGESAPMMSETVLGVKNGEEGSLVFDLEVETTDNENFAALMSFAGADGGRIREDLRVVIDNSENFAPTAGADFYLNPKTRNNTEADPRVIVNAANGKTVKSVFEGLTFVSDGWVLDSETSTRCLRVLDGEKVSISYDAYSDATGDEGLTIELDMATRNVTDESGTLLTMGTMSAIDNMPVGLWVKAQESCFATTLQRIEGSQNWIYRHDKRTHVAVNIVPNLYNQGTNYVRVFINGIISREFVYSDSDRFWQAMDGVKKTGGIQIAPSGADIDIYALRVYKKPMSATEIRQNYLASLPTVEEKKAFKAKNDILGDSGLISYAKCYNMYNTLLYKGTVPSLQNQDRTVGDVVVHKPGDPAHSGTLYSMTRKGQGSTSKKYWAWNVQSDFKEADSRWVDENGVDHGQCYQNADGLPMAKKLVDKRNWASSMQSHKIGATRMYNDLYREVVGKNEITSMAGKDNCRVAVYEDPFLVFEQREGDAEPVFIGLGTFGSGKADKPSFGYSDKDESRDMLMIEGSDNNTRLTKHQVPWIDGDVVYDEKGEGYTYGGGMSWDYDLGNRDTISRFKEAFNFVYLHSNRLKPFDGTYTQLKASTGMDTSCCYWVTKAESGSARYDMYCYSEVAGTWVPGGASKDEGGVYATLNVKEQTKARLSASFTEHEQFMEWDKVNEDFVEARRAAFAEGIGSRFHLKDIMFFMNMMKLLAACDNRAKNTYLWVYDKSSLIRAMQDDLDSILHIDNQGKLTKPYYVEEHDYDETLHKNYWNGEDNALYNMMEECFPTELRNNMNEILTAMSKLGGGSLEGFWEEYFFKVQRYFPAVAYNEFARIGYEYAHYQMVSGNYNNDTDPITQSLGSQEEGERQWVEDRNMYISSLAEYGLFAETAKSGKMIFRSTEQMDVDMSFRTARWMYPVVLLGQTAVLSGQRAEEGKAMSVVCKTDSNTQITMLGADYMSDIGTWWDKPLNGEFTFAGKRIKQLLVGNDNVNAIRFKATRIYVQAMSALRVLDVHNVTTLTGELDLSGNTRLTTLDARNTMLRQVHLPRQEFLTTVRLPETLTDLTLDGQRGLADPQTAGLQNMQNVYINQSTCPLIDSKAMTERLRDSKNLISLTLVGVDWADVTADTLRWLLDKGAKVSGHMAMADGEQVDATLKMRIVGAWGNVDDTKNALTIDYEKTAITKASLSGRQYFGEEGNYTLKLTTSPSNGNDIVGVAWEMTENEWASINASTGVITVNEVGEKAEDNKATVKATVTLSDGREIETSMDVHFYRYEAQLGDYLFADATYGPSLSSSDATPVGVVFYLDPERRWGLALSLADYGQRVWGLYSGSLPNITLNEYLSSAYDVPSIENYTNGNGTTVTDSNYLDSTESGVDGFKTYPKQHALGDIGFEEVTSKMYNEQGLGDYLDRLGLGVGDLISAGQLKTLRIIQHRDSILSDTAVNLPIPQPSATQTEAQHLAACISDVVKNHGNNGSYQQYYFPAASYCYAYRPNVRADEELAENLGPRHWFLPSEGEVMRMVFLQRKGTNGENKWAVFSNAVGDGRMVKLTASQWYWCSAEFDGGGVWIAIVQSGQASVSGRFGASVVRPAVAFRL